MHSFNYHIEFTRPPHAIQHGVAGGLGATFKILYLGWMIVASSAWRFYQCNHTPRRTVIALRVDPEAVFGRGHSCDYPDLSLSQDVGK
jgi:hypothetical protein